MAPSGHMQPDTLNRRTARLPFNKAHCHAQPSQLQTNPLLPHFSTTLSRTDSLSYTVWDRKKSVRGHTTQWACNTV